MRWKMFDRIKAGMRSNSLESENGNTVKKVELRKIGWNTMNLVGKGGIKRKSEEFESGRGDGFLERLAHIQWNRESSAMILLDQLQQDVIKVVLGFQLDVEFLVFLVVSWTNSLMLEGIRSDVQAFEQVIKLLRSEIHPE